MLLTVAMLLTGCEGKAPSGDNTAAPAASPHAPASKVTGTEPPALESGMVNPGYEEKPAWFANSFLAIRDDVSEAAAAGKRVILYFYQDGCPYCKKLLDMNFSLAGTVKRTREKFEVIAINMWGDREVTGFDGEATTEKEFARSLRVMFTPTMLFLNEQSDVVLRLNGYYPPHKFNAALDFAAQHNGDSPRFLEYLATVSPPAASGVLHRDASLAPGTRLNTLAGDRPLLVTFEQHDCAPCDELHLEILKRAESREQLARFDILVLDMWSDDVLVLANGTETTPAQWARELDIKYAPSLVFFDTENREVFRTDGYLKAFHIQSAMDYVASGAYLDQPEFQRFIAERAGALEARGIHVDLMD
jgi:thioredoxin-related protein